MKSNNLYAKPSIAAFPGSRAMAGLCVAVVTGLAGLATLPRTTTDMDGAEFALIAARGGIAHPPGYPLYSAMLRAWHEAFARWFAVPPEITSPRSLAALSVVLSVATAWILWAAVMTWYGRPARAAHRTSSGPWCVAAAVLAVMLAAPVWRANTGIEPFALNNLMAAALAWIAARALTARPAMIEEHREKIACATGLLFGLAFCNHHSLAFALPLAIPALVSARGRVTGGAARGFVAGFVVGLVPLVWFTLQRENPDGLVWGDWSHFLTRLDNHLFRRDYGTLSLKTAAEGEWWSGPVFMAGVYRNGLTWLWTVAALAGAVLATSPESKSRPGSRLSLEALAAASFLTTGLLMPALFRLEPAPDTAAIMERFAALPLMFLAVPIASLLTGVDSRLGPAARKGFVIFCLAAVAFQAATQFASSDRKVESIADAHIRASIAAIDQPGESGLPTGTWIVTNTDLDFFGFNYWTADLRPRPVVIQTGLWTSVWYREKILADIQRAGFALDAGLVAGLQERIPEDSAFAALSGILAHAARTQEVLLSAGTFPGMDRLLENSFPEASFIRVLQGPIPHHNAIVEANVRHSAPLAKELAGNPCRTAWDCYALDGWLRTWTALAESSRVMGDQDQLKICADQLAAFKAAQRQIP
jgi:hypothetical protein